MPSSFAHTMRALEHTERWVLWLAPALVVLGGWGIWLVFARVDVYASAPRARIEVNRMASRVSAQQDGRIVTLRCTLGSVVRGGEVLVELDSSIERAQLAQELTALSSLRVRADALTTQIAAEQAKRLSRSRMNELATKQAGFGLQQAQVAASHQEELASIAQQLERERLTARIDAANAAVALSSSRLKVDDAALEVEHLRALSEYEDKAELASIAVLERQLAELKAEQLLRRAAIATVQVTIEQRRIVAPASGKLGNIAALQIGDVVKAGDVIATIIPTDDVRIVAEFAPDDAVGRILPGQSARVRLHGFSWIEFGMLEASVIRVASEPRDGTIRVELLIDAGHVPPDIPVQHGLPGSVEVRIDNVSPWALLMRSIGSRLERPLRAEPVAPYLARQATP
jgi:multidrug resistance efflux pump